MNTDDDAKKAIAAMKASMTPMIDEALLGFFKMMDEALSTAAETEIDRCVGVVEACRLKESHQLGPMYGAGWNGAIQFAADAMRDWKKHSAASRKGSPPNSEDK